MAEDKILFSVTRNDTALNFIEEEKSRGATERKPDDKGNVDHYGLLKGEKYPAPQASDLQMLVAWLGDSNALKILAAKTSQWAQYLTEEVRAQFDIKDGATWTEEAVAAFIKYAETFSMRGEPMAALLEKREQLLEKMASYDTETPEGFKAAMELFNKELTPLKREIDAKKRKTKDEAEAAAS